MNTNLPNKIVKLFEKYGRCKIVNHELSYTGYGVCAVVKTQEDEFVLIRYHSSPKVWTLPCGTVEQNESFEEACIRETFEETGLTIRVMGLFRIFHFTQKATVSQDRTESYVVVFLAKVISGVMSSKTPEILEVKQFNKLPETFAGELGKYYVDLM